MKKRIHLITKTVKDLLEKYPHLRDDDNRLILAIWNEDLMAMGLNGNTIAYRTFVSIYANGKLTNPESIRRSRQKVQQDYPHLCGKSKDNRDQNQDEIKSQLGYPGTTQKLF